jgi:hypothetical protein
MLESYLIVSNQVEYNLVDRSAELEMLPFCEAHRITMFAYSPLVRAKSALSDRRAAVMGIIAERYHCSIPQIMLAWLMRQTCVVPIVKSFTPENITRNIEAAAIDLAPEDAAEVSRLFAQHPLTLEPARIRVVQNPEENRRFYETFSEAMENPCGYTPGPRALAEVLRRGEILKPIKVVRSIDPTGRFEFDLVEGQIRYWAHVFAFGEHEPIKALLRDG